MRHRAAGFLVITVACLMLLPGSGASTRPLGIGYLDFPVTAQDEAVYSHAAIAMAESGEWSTPTFLGRFFLYKPPLLYWLSGVSAKLFGVSGWALRLPSMLAASLTAGLVYVWVFGSAGWWRALLAVAVLIATPLFRELGSRNMTDALVMAVIVTAAWLMARGTMLGAVTACIAAGILAKSLAGLIPILILGLWWCIVTREQRPSLAKAAVIAGLGLLAAAPWFVFQWETHRRWFEAEFIGVELLAYGASAPPQTSAESAGVFYGSRLFRANPVLLIGFLFSLPVLWKAIRQHTAESAALAASLGVMAAAIGSYQYRNATYLLPLIPLMAVAFAGYASLRSLILTALVGVLVAAFSGVPDAPPPHPGRAVLRTAEQYCDMQRGNELIVAGIADDFSIATLPLSRLRYAIRGAARSEGQVTLDFRKMGIVLPVAEFLDGPAAQALYALRLREWGLPDGRALGTVISWDEPADLARLVEASPDRDFLFAEREAPSVVSPAHRSVAGTGGAILLLANKALRRPAPARRACRL